MSRVTRRVSRSSASANSCDAATMVTASVRPNSENKAFSFRNPTSRKMCAQIVIRNPVI